MSSARMRVTFVLASGFGLGGGDRVIANLARQLCERGHTVNLISRPPRRLPWYKRRAQAMPLRESHFDSLPVPRRVLERYRPVVDADVPDADVVIATWWETAEWVAALSRRKGAKAHLIQHHETFDYLPQSRTRAAYCLSLHKIVVAQWLQELMRREYSNACVSRIRQGIDVAQFHALPRARQAVPTIGFMYSQTPWKGTEVIRETIERVRRALPVVRVRAVGLDTPSRALPLPPATDFLYRPPQAQLPAFYASCDVWLCGSWTEGFTLPPMEAMACRCPVVSTRVGGPDEMIREGVNGYLVEPGDAAALGQRLVDVLTSHATRWRGMSDAAYATAREYTWERAADDMQAALCRAIERTARDAM